MRILFERKKTRFIARVLLFVSVIQIFQPLAASALTSGPGQPEAQSFQPAGVSDMVDLVSGDFKYNIPLMDIDGYPLNLNYQSGVGIDDEASWVGLGWNLNVGAINRQLRGLPDDFAGDSVVTQHYTKPKVTVGGRITAKVEVKGKAKLGGSFTFGAFSDNYTGIGAEIGANAGISYSFANDGLMTAGMGIGVLSNTASGVDVTPNVSFSIMEHGKEVQQQRAGLSASLGYNSRSGLKSLNFGSTFKGLQANPSISFNTEPIYPKVQVPYRSDYSSFSFDVGFAAAIVFTGAGGTGYLNTRRVEKETQVNPGYGFLYAEKGKDNKSAVMDFLREKENPVIPELPNLALPVHTPDIFSYNSQVGSGQFRLYRGGTGAYFDNESTDKSGVNTLGFDAGGGLYAHGGVTFFNQSTHTTTRKWTSENNYLSRGDFQDEPSTDLNQQHVFFRKVDEKNLEDNSLSGKLNQTSLLSVTTSGKTANASFRSQSSLGSNITNISSPITKNERQMQGTMVSYLTANEASKGGLDKNIGIYDFNNLGSFEPPVNHQPIKTAQYARVTGSRKAHHLSEITVNDPAGSRSVFGLPVYNLKQEEYSFAVGASYTSKDGLVGIGASIPRNRGIDHYYHKDQTGAYAYSYLLTGVLSPDYVDKTGDGITDDDNGTGIRFNYSRIGNYKWRTPYYNATLGNTAALNKAMLADPEDDKASIVYGEKEIYYVHTIESKTKIAYFITENRKDGLGVSGINGGSDLNTRQKCLKEIRLYSKADVTKPIKVVKFDYNYELCPGTPNSIADAEPGMAKGQGKLTLKKVWFEYGGTQKGANHPYVFTYQSKIDGNVIEYATMATDRWGMFKFPVSNPGGLSNEEFPYASQDRTTADKAAALWHLQTIELPSGGKISVNYEADDYAYVQDKEAMEMVPMDLLGSTTLEGARGVKIPLSKPYPANSGLTPTAWFKKTYLNGADYMYTKAMVKISTSNAPSNGRDYDFIPAYCKVSEVQITGDLAEVKFEMINEADVEMNPIRFAAWQRLKNEYPRYAYPGYQNRVKDNPGGVQAAVNAILGAARNLSELKENFYKKAQRKGYARELVKEKSFVRIAKTSGVKIGGGLRVKKVMIEDNWDDFTGDQVPRAIYGQSYEYTTMRDGVRISSGVVSYEPSIGNDENPLKQPVPYVQKIKGAINNFFELEEPFGESFFPAPEVAYSKVIVRDLEAGGEEVELPKTGYIVNEFYTAKDFPVFVKATDIQRYNPRPAFSYSLIKTNSIEEMVLSQGYSIEINDMHGKPKAVKVFNASGAEISGTEYFYQVQDPKAQALRLNNVVKVVNPDGYVVDKVLGRDIEFFTDFREQETSNNGTAVNLGVDVIPFFFGFPLPIPHWPTNGNNEYKLFRSACAVKVVRTTGIINKVVKTENGSSIAIENVAYDGLTGEALVTRTQNEFKKYLYSVNLPAYWVYKKMGGAYQNLGMVLKDVEITSGTEINPVYWSVLRQGDEVVNLNNGTTYWVIDQTRQGTYSDVYSKVLMDRDGQLVRNLNKSNFKVTRSAYRNLLSQGAASIVSLGDPLRTGRLMLYSDQDLGDYKLISASAATYSEDWASKLDCSLTKLKPPIANTNHCFSFISGAQSNLYGNNGARITHPTEGSTVVVKSTYWGGIDYGGGVARMAEADTIARPAAKMALAAGCTEPYMGGCNRSEPSLPPNQAHSSWALNRSGIWLSIAIPSNLDEWIGFEKEVNILRSDIYYMGFGADNGMNVFIDGHLIGELSTSSSDSYNYWTVKPIELSQGKHRLRVEFLNKCVADANNESNAGTAGLEIYDAPYSSLINGTYSASNPPPMLFTTRDLRGKTDTQVFRTLNGSRIWYYTNEDGSPYDVLLGSTQYINPFVQGYKGNWNLQEQKVFQEQRDYDRIFNEGKKGIDVKNAGYLRSFNSFYTFSSQVGWRSSVNPVNWVTANAVTLYDRYGQELENKDALGRYSAANFDFNGELPAAVASNAMNREIYTNSFEDFKFRKQTDPECIGTEFASLTTEGIDALTSPAKAHSGNYSLRLNSTGIRMKTQLHNLEHKTNDYLIRDTRGFALSKIPGIYPNGFEPRPAQRYIFNVWVKDAQPTNKSVNITAGLKGVAGAEVPMTLSCKAIVEGWKLLEGVIDLSGVAGDKLEFTLKSKSAEVNIDDIRIHPMDAHMKSYAYNDKNFRLMAELDENAFATFYEYDDEGSLVRVKKETERGIVTLKENRSSYKKRAL
ncbi:hypothetical protein PBAL39_13367 [Pedobacter sp. BAL39]|uniref:hypothetical protein n=1 Tax=Pedobacter sp. BAL39 TaxID=391596 RepID=UPI0001559872|nr:hypothetical protein [Pedobacter sp. BAL39]EDM35224.1 hypothetical protein PBAL39_13367 [Pedobacter sp. BAL39]